MKHQTFLMWFFIFLVWAFYRANFQLPESVDEFIVKPLVFVMPIVYLVWVKENKSLKEIGLGIKLKGLVIDLYIGVVLGILLAVEGLLANYLKYGKFSFLPIEALFIAGGIGSFLLINIAASVSEEIFGRGYLYNRLFKTSKEQAACAVVSSFLFMLIHIPIMFTRLHLTGNALIFYPLSIFTMGVVNSYVFTMRKNLVLPVLIHTFWNMTVSLYL
ncbi:hypothetical protein A3D05_01995 [Candidatus Gottesmanbacteria bacterium RIFCSPHIGHO2_02_FULL_40_24]|uniref:CAAX prenyl protease 2/Lysostaphin resistance protein A-like domain-containing protein n=1 Tax=Candidatus Gottesmanbacteria bacterium RIFCSPHIGHO2_01_FULL_40_15 TaxID=1798376 RepID=A0A1F5Z3N3_9BACT|nr:MAG: hypothetical protein A2777_04255 [Candidatus Gottesmanbacteria bacterium RIFCSPHIGHO2_01_FULL_40_15]OGG18627.1 MAG: hypothetical protein A3D05_01995 [Candidatus Gottesmanbacteria bacterium RIFCSPHIGHO2_02_FULL_40_24]OGG22827.1 MAG: hypothetical protein A3B48_05570 [Candidatus Gottesmanbacteria bacterium RIFCSPLOWO2_01_FULL_40_10]OGG24938.1 MAG: hypothetical protein A3E42_02800 [Candidatus Gottesmanbacteria bacterium RIFCSPHIGHO2_12_FULL_40_13]OGG31719.1 MAG: hypothetical protein A3I80_0